MFSRLHKCNNICAIDNALKMEQQRPQLLIISISLLYWFRNTADCWKFDSGGPGALGPGNAPLILTRPARSPSGVVAARGPSPVVASASNSRGGSFAALLHAQQQDILYACPLNSMCQCAGLPNETSTLIEINCNEVELYKFPGELNPQNCGN
uniref:Uncharacterized protein n=1 Tax=Glossina pallidipes TaxID=7398 RepID=A0A1A9Z995_GLOPL